MDRGSLSGLVLGAVAIFGAQWLHGGALSLFMQPSAFLIVGIGTLAAVLLHYPLPVFMQGVRMVRWAFHPVEPDVQALIRRLVGWANTARNEGPLALERQVAMTQDPFLKNGLQMVVDGIEPAQLREAMDVRLVQFENTERGAARVWEAAGGYAPTFGILGAVIGLIQVMENLSAPGKLGAGIAVAFVATLYGVGLANLVFLPLANKIKFSIARRVQEREVMCDGLMGIAQGEHPRLIEMRLKGYL